MRESGGITRVLFMEDSEIIVNSLRDCFDDLGYAIEFARDGNEAIAKYKAAKGKGVPYQVLVMDLEIKNGMGGEETITRLREFDPEVKAVVTSGHTSRDIILKPEKFGFQGSLVKPYSLEELTQAVLEAQKKR
jgi:CheY-like chemotaxis protein